MESIECADCHHQWRQNFDAAKECPRCGSKLTFINPNPRTKMEL